MVIGGGCKAVSWVLQQPGMGVMRAHELQTHLPWTERSQGIGLHLTACTASVSCAALQTPSTLAGV